MKDWFDDLDDYEDEEEEEQTSFYDEDEDRPNRILIKVWH